MRYQIIEKMALGQSAPHRSNIAKLTPFSVACADSGTPRARTVYYAPRAFQIGGFSMQKIDYAKLLGFAAVSDQLSEAWISKTRP